MLSKKLSYIYLFIMTLILDLDEDVRTTFKNILIAKLKEYSGKGKEDIIKLMQKIIEEYQKENK